jgi:hypothetical protein
LGRTSGVLLAVLVVAPATAQVSRATRPGPQVPSSTQLASVEIDAELTGYARLLDSPEWSVRAGAAQRLFESTHDDIQLFAILEQIDLTMEQRHRLIQVVWNRLLSTPGAALGIRMDPWAQEEVGVVVTEVLPGMPAEAVLDPGDRITHIDGLVLINSGTLQNIIQAKRPGQTADLRIVRQRRDARGEVVRDPAGEPVVETVDAEVSLASVDDLAEYGSDPVVRANNPVRQLIAQEVVQRYRPRHGYVERGPRELDPDVVGHPDIVEITTHLTLVNEGRLRVSRELREYWQATLRNLERAAADPAATAADRDLARRVAERYRVLLPD